MIADMLKKKLKPEKKSSKTPPKTSLEAKGNDYRLWSGRSSGHLDDIAVELGASIELDKELYREDIRGSIAHAQMLKKIGILSAVELKTLQNGLCQIRSEIESDAFHFDARLEDIHTHIEKRLLDICGLSAKRLHTARSRNDQIAVDTHLYVRSHCVTLMRELLSLCQTLLRRAEESIDILLPGYTHLQIAQPIRLSHHLLSHFWAFTRDIQRFNHARQAAGLLPLGSGAFAGVNYMNDREFLRRKLDFDAIYPNSMDAVSSRDHILDFVYAASVCMTHTSRLSEEIVIWHSQEFAYVELPDTLTTGSSIMPQKKNPDLAELVRGKTGRVQANLYNLFTNLKALPLSYNRDLQEDRFPLLDTRKQVQMCLRALTAMVDQARYNAVNMRRALQKGFAVATDLADALVQQKQQTKNMSFRDAHHIVGALVKYCIEHGLILEQVDETQRRSISPYLSEEAFYQKAIDLESSVEKKKSYGGTTRASQKKQIRDARRVLKKMAANIN